MAVRVERDAGIVAVTDWDSMTALSYVRADESNV